MQTNIYLVQPSPITTAIHCLFAIVPLLALTVISARMGYRGFRLIWPWAVFLGVVILGGLQGFFIGNPIGKGAEVFARAGLNTTIPAAGIAVFALSISLAVMPFRSFSSTGSTHAHS